MKNNKINENNIKSYIDQNIPKLSWSETFFKLKKEVDIIKNNQKEEELCSIQYNYTPIFMYYAIKSNCSINEFEKILQISDNYEDGLNRYFGYADCSYDEQEESHIYDKMNYLFYKKENNKIIIDENKIEYIYKIIENVRKNNLLDFHSSKISFFLKKTIEQNSVIGKKLLHIINETPNMLVEENKLYNSLQLNMIYLVANDSYEKNVSNIYNIFKENEIMNDMMEKNIINCHMTGVYKTQLSIYNLIRTQEENYFDIFMNRVKYLKTILENEKYEKLIEDILYSIKEGIKKHPFTINLEDIKIENNIIDIVPYCIALGAIIKNGHYKLIIGQHTQLQKQLENIKEKMQNYEKNDSGLDFEQYYILRNIEFDSIEKFFHYQSLNNKHQEKKDTIKKYKI